MLFVKTGGWQLAVQPGWADGPPSNNVVGGRRNYSQTQHDMTLLLFFFPRPSFQPDWGTHSTYVRQFRFHKGQPSFKSDAFASHILYIFRFTRPFPPFALDLFELQGKLATNMDQTRSYTVEINNHAQLNAALLLLIRTCSWPHIPLLDPSGLLRSRSSMEAPTCYLFLYMTGIVSNKRLCGPENSFPRSHVGDTMSGACQCLSSRPWSELQE